MINMVLGSIAGLLAGISYLLCRDEKKFKYFFLGAWIIVLLIVSTQDPFNLVALGIVVMIIILNAYFDLKESKETEELKGGNERWP